MVLTLSYTLNHYTVKTKRIILRRYKLVIIKFDVLFTSVAVFIWLANSLPAA